jgi:Vacuolar protein sorting-associated protein 62/Insecticidal Crystal Toxin, P42/Bacterial Ig-like domain (group 2)
MTEELLFKRASRAFLVRVCRLFFPCVVFCAIMVDSCSKSPTEPANGNGTVDSRILSSLLSVAVIPGRSETIIVTATKEDGSPDTYTASIDNGAVATITQSDSAVEVTGAGYGKATLTITSGSGSIKKIPVQVYNHHVLDVGELQISFVDTFEVRVTTNPAALLCHPVIPEGYHALGSFASPGYDNPNGKCAMMVVKQAEGSDALAEPIDYNLIWCWRENVIVPDPFPHSVPETSLTLWRPVPPDGYRQMGAVVVGGPEKPNLSDVVCVREDLTTFGSAGSRVTYNYSQGYMSCWTVEPPIAGPHEMAYLQTGTFAVSLSWTAPPNAALMNILKVDLPVLAEGPAQTYTPRLEGYEMPPVETVPLLGKVMLTPCTIVNDLDYIDQLGWRIANSPFYFLERQVFYKLLYHNYNQTSVEQTNTYTYRSGVEKGESDTYFEKTSVSVTAELGVNIEWFSGKVSTTLSKELGYQTQTSVKELEQTYISSSINTPPGKAAALWQKYNRLVLKRHKGTTLEPVAVWEFGINSFVTDQYPD